MGSHFTPYVTYTTDGWWCLGGDSTRFSQSTPAVTCKLSTTPTLTRNGCGSTLATANKAALCALLWSRQYEQKVGYYRKRSGRSHENAKLWFTSDCDKTIRRLSREGERWTKCKKWSRKSVRICRATERVDPLHLTGIAVRLLQRHHLGLFHTSSAGIRQGKTSFKST